MRFVIPVALGLLFYSMLAELSVVRGSDFEVTLNTPFQSTVEVDGKSVIKPLLLLPCKGALSIADKTVSDLFIIIKNTSQKDITLNLRNPTRIKITLLSETGIESEKDIPKEVACSFEMPRSPSQMFYKIAVGSSRVCKVNFFDRSKLIDDPIDYLWIQGVSKVRISYVGVLSDNSLLTVTSGWLPVDVFVPSNQEASKMKRSYLSVPPQEKGNPPTVKEGP